MLELCNATFECGRLPRGWMEQQGSNCTFERGALRSGAATRLEVPVPGNGWRRLHVEIEVEPIGGAALTCSDRTLTMSVDLRRHTQDILFYGGAPLAQRRREIPARPGAHVVTFAYDHGRLRILVDGTEAVAGDDPRPTPVAGRLSLSFWDDCLIRRVRILGDEPLAEPLRTYPPRRRQDFFLEVNVDFVDDLIRAPYTRDMFDQMFAEFKNWGVRRCHWIHYGVRGAGIFETIGSPQNALRTMENVGDIFTAAVEAAHAHGVEIIGMMKPFDMGFAHSCGEGSPDYGRARLRRIGGALDKVADFPAAHREFIMRRKPGVWGAASENEIFHRIDLVKEDDRPAAFSVNDLELYVSDENTTYRRYDGPSTREEVIEDYPVWEHTASGGRPTGQSRRSRVMRLTNLAIREKYMVLSVSGRTASFANSLINLAHVFGEKGEERRLTYGVLPRALRPDPGSGATACRQPPDFRLHGIEFDANSNVSAVHPGYSAIRMRHAFDGNDGLLAFARGKDDGPSGLLSPSFPETRAWWLSWLRHCLEAGADGIELRVRSHNFCFAWAEFGFEQPVRDEFLRRCGVDIWATDDFDLAAWRRLRGEGYTEFYRQAKRLAAAYGKPMGIHVSPTNDMEPEVGAAMEIHWDWRRWIDEGLADSVTMKEVWPRTRLAEEILAHTRPKGIPVVFCPYANNIFGRRPAGEEVCANWIQMARDGGYDGYQFYECAAVIEGTADGRIVMRQPALRELFRREFARR